MSYGENEPMDNTRRSVFRFYSYDIELMSARFKSETQQSFLNKKNHRVTLGMLWIIFINSYCAVHGTDDQQFHFYSSAWFVNHYTLENCKQFPLPI